MKKLFSAAAVAALLSASAYAASVDSNAGADIIAPLQITNATALYFGTIAPSLTEGGSVVVSPAGGKTCATALTCLTDDHTAAAFDVTGEADASYTISLPTSVQISNGAGANMTIDSFAGSKTSGTLVSGQDNFTVGGSLAVSANQATGEYTGTFAVTVEYQ
ncbi:MAG: DUF4402 domain-containing protein [Pseudomonadota bacterium]